MDDKRFLIRNCVRIVKKTQAHMDIVLKEYELSSGSYPYLLELRGNEGIHCENLSKKLGVDKAMSTRTIRKLVQLGYLTKIPDELDSRASKLYLTEKARDCIPEILTRLEQWIDFITDDLSEPDKNSVFESLAKIENKTYGEGQCAK